ncbi:hypothetical protein BEWA_051320 [Theileria equi strain WA]|uniref:Uncharacterized protein n=1 Tax=Theileria equi strain WA TaxID=1537102 RepID=L1LCV2_THEEQ|nr:hypothetical protein BEWA_051320 [Theileria equi strain WA]EKX73080.1 hypothetical protein BEWA_051320 [Theileria equi strain WA]|eukprot:XP_004832532.1 hypothetical protein BEWA_051320 [Theileria equi strain WA]
MSNQFAIEINIGEKTDYYYDNIEVIVDCYDTSDYSRFTVKCFMYNGQKVNIHSPFIDVSYVNVYYANDVNYPLLIGLHLFSAKHVRNVDYYFVPWSNDNWNGYAFGDSNSFGKSELPEVMKFLKDDRGSGLDKLKFSSGRISKVRYNGGIFIMEGHNEGSSGEYNQKVAERIHTNERAVMLVYVFFLFLAVVLIGIFILRSGYGGPLFLGYRPLQ